MTNVTPLRREVDGVIAGLERSLDALRTTFASEAASSDAERSKLIADGRAAIERARANGSAFMIWQQILDEFEHGSPDERGTDYDVIRKFASFMDSAQGKTMEPKLSVSVNYHPRTINDLDRTLDALTELGVHFTVSEFGLRGYAAEFASGYMGEAVMIFCNQTAGRDALARQAGRASEAEEPLRGSEGRDGG